jgi:uncharacterized paraquat-inducible protein A
MHVSDEGPRLDSIECPRCYILFDLVHRARTPYLVCPRCQLLRIIPMRGR